MQGRFHMGSVRIRVNQRLPINKFRPVGVAIDEKWLGVVFELIVCEISEVIIFEFCLPVYSISN